MLSRMKTKYSKLMVDKLDLFRPFLHFLISVLSRNAKNELHFSFFFKIFAICVRVPTKGSAFRSRGQKIPVLLYIFIYFYRSTFCNRGNVVWQENFDWGILLFTKFWLGITTPQNRTTLHICSYAPATKGDMKSTTLPVRRQNVARPQIESAEIFW